ncbi:unnamed protein product [Protopolystoma xenopodis]|uniref:Uncharacterized protein n=1 Tax=Protopolystoma xenopodis TaxID=117903 RepID=A0A3S5B5K6_9PLAT|nr:unnamed protein product [Protopolystoma xenopodis]
MTGRENERVRGRDGFKQKTSISESDGLRALLELNGRTGSKRRGEVKWEQRQGQVSTSKVPSSSLSSTLSISISCPSLYPRPCLIAWPSDLQAAKATPVL